MSKTGFTHYTYRIKEVNRYNEEPKYYAEYGIIKKRSLLGLLLGRPNIEWCAVPFMEVCKDNEPYRANNKLPLKSTELAKIRVQISLHKKCRFFEYMKEDKYSEIVYEEDL